MDNVATNIKSANRWKKQRLAELEGRVLCVNAETQIAQARVLAFMLKAVAEWPNEIRLEMIGWAGSLLEDTLDRLELAIEKEVAHG